MPYLKKIVIYPIKSLDGVAVTKATVLKSGALQHDRQFAIFDTEGRFINSKRTAKINLIRSHFDLEKKIVSLEIPGEKQAQFFQLDEEIIELEAWLSEYFQLSVKLGQNSFAGFPDDTNASGPTVIATETINSVASWFPKISADEMRSRMRVNLEFADVPAFWEDQLFTKAGEVVQFKVGEVLFQGINPCQRCVVPTRDPVTGQVYPDFQKIFVSKRQNTLPQWAEISHFNHFYRLSVNTRIPESEAGKILQLGDEVKIL